MARKMLIAGNWKMNGLTTDSVALATEIKAAVKAKKRSCEFFGMSAVYNAKYS